ncbi:hypothetical protein AGMMS50267_11270 [Spirochaetia bacterium]|nr:hypothetical protein AGMMS50267_11270 [Spirochaetia bacterium]
MKRYVLFLGVLVFIPMFGALVIGCPSATGGGGDDPPPPALIAGLYADTDLTTALDLSAQTEDTLLAKALAWLDANADGRADTAYTIILPAGRTQSPAKTLDGATFKDGAKLTLKGVDSSSTITLTGTGSLFTIAASSNITLVLDENVTLKGVPNNNAPLIMVNSGDVLEMKGNAKITGNASTARAGGVSVSDGTFNMSGNASISDNASSYGMAGVGGVSVGGTFNMSGNASISYNTATGTNGSGGVVSSGSFTMRDNASINYNTAIGMNGSGGVLFGGGSFTMRDNASINYNIATAVGGGVRITSGIFTMQDNAGISMNTASNAGGGVDIRGNGVFNMNGSASISGNTVSSGMGGGVVILENGTFTKTGASVIYGDTDGVHNSGDTENTLIGSTSGRGHAVYLNTGGGKYRDSTAGAGVTMSWNGTTAVGFEN